MAPRNGSSRIDSPVPESVIAAKCASGLRANGLSTMEAISLEIIEPALADDGEDLPIGKNDCHLFAHPLEPAIEQGESDRAAKRRAEIARANVADHFHRRRRHPAGFSGDDLAAFGH